MLKRLAVDPDELMEGPRRNFCILHALHMKPPRNDKGEALNVSTKAELA